MTTSDILSSPVIGSLIVAGASWLWSRIWGKSKRADNVLDIAERVYQAAEGAGLVNAMDGTGKARAFVAMFAREWKAQHGKAPGPAELAAAVAYADHASLAAKAGDATVKAQLDEVTAVIKRPAHVAAPSSP